LSDASQLSQNLLPAALDAVVRVSQTKTAPDRSGAALHSRLRDLLATCCVTLGVTDCKSLFDQHE
jgi:hypothetical protein